MAGDGPVWNPSSGVWEASAAVRDLQDELEALKARVAVLEAAGTQGEAS